MGYDMREVIQVLYDNIPSDATGMSAYEREWYRAVGCLLREDDVLREQLREAEVCHAQTDGDCEWSDCPQLRDGEPVRSGRHCPLDLLTDLRRELQEARQLLDDRTRGNRQLRSLLEETEAEIRHLTDALRYYVTGGTMPDRARRALAEGESDGETIRAD